MNWLFGFFPIRSVLNIYYCGTILYVVHAVRLPVWLQSRHVSRDLTMLPDFQVTCTTYNNSNYYYFHSFIGFGFFFISFIRFDLVLFLSSCHNYGLITLLSICVEINRRLCMYPCDLRICMTMKCFHKYAIHFLSSLVAL